MAESKYESSVKAVATSAHDIYRVLGNMENIALFQDLIPKDKVQELTYDKESVHLKVDGLGQKICIRIVDREEDKTLKYGVDNLPISANFWIQMKEVAPSDSRIKLTIKADFPMMIKMMLGNKLQEGLEQAATMLAQVPYNEIK